MNDVKNDFKVTPAELSTLVENRNEGSATTLKVKYGGVKGIADALKSNCDSGIRGDDLDIRRLVLGSNILALKEARSFLALCWEAIQDFTLLILLACAVVNIITSFFGTHENAWVGTFPLVFHYTCVSSRLVTLPLSCSPVCILYLYMYRSIYYSCTEGVALIGTVLLVVAVSAATDYTKEKQFMALNAMASDIKLNVTRNGVAMQISTMDLVCGDLLW